MDRRTDSQSRQDSRSSPLHPPFRKSAKLLLPENKESSSKLRLSPRHTRNLVPIRHGYTHSRRRLNTPFPTKIGRTFHTGELAVGSEGQLQTASYFKLLATHCVSMDTVNPSPVSHLTHASYVDLFAIRQRLRALFRAHSTSNSLGVLTFPTPLP